MIRALLLLLLSLPAWGADWYVRPLGGDYGTENGTSYANAFDGDADAWALSADIDSGDRVYICGTHREPITVQEPGVTIDLGCPGDPAILDGTARFDHTGWTAQHGGYCRALTANSGTPISAVVSGRVGPRVWKNGAPLTLGSIVSGLQTGQWGCGNTSGMPNDTCASAAYTVCVKDEPVAGDVFEIPVMSRLISFNPGNFSTMVGASVTIDGGADEGAKLYRGLDIGIGKHSDSITKTYDTWTISNVHCEYMGSQCVHAFGVATGEISRVRVSDVTCEYTGGECLYIKDFITDEITVDDVDCDNNGWNWITPSDYSGDCADVHTASGTFAPAVSITNVDCANSIGTAVYMGYGGRVDSTKVRDCANTVADLGGITWSGELAGQTTHVTRSDIKQTKPDYVGIEIKGNSTDDPTLLLYGNRIECGDLTSSIAIDKSSTHFTNVHLFNNSVRNCYRGFWSALSTENPVTSSLNDNLFEHVTRPWDIGKAAGSLGGLALNNNAASPSGLDATPYCLNNGATCNATPQSPAANTVTGDLDMTGWQPSENSSVCRAASGGRSGLYYGGLRFGPDPDIGAYPCYSPRD